MAAKKKAKKTIDALAKQNARYERHLKRASAKPAPASCICGRSLAKPEAVAVEVPKPEMEEPCTNSPE